MRVTASTRSIRLPPANDVRISVGRHGARLLVRTAGSLLYFANWKASKMVNPYGDTSDELILSTDNHLSNFQVTAIKHSRDPATIAQTALLFGRRLATCSHGRTQALRKLQQHRPVIGNSCSEAAGTTALFAVSKWPLGGSLPARRCYNAALLMGDLRIALNSNKQFGRSP
jgi:hypothetical protein